MHPNSSVYPNRLFFLWPFLFAASVDKSPPFTFTQTEPTDAWKLNFAQTNVMNGQITRGALIFSRLRVSPNYGYQIKPATKLTSQESQDSTL